MDLEDIWQNVLGSTEILRMYMPRLGVASASDLPYIFLAESDVNRGDTVVRKGVVKVDKPVIYLTDGSPQFYGFKFEDELKVNPETLKTFLIMRGVQLPSFKYTQSSSLEVYEGSLQDAIDEYSDLLARKENTDTGLIKGLSGYWQFSVLAYVTNIVAKSAPDNIRGIIKRLNERDRK